MIPADARAMILESLAAGCALSLACKGAGVAEADCRASMSEPTEEGRAFAAAVSRAADEGARAIVQASRPAPPKPEAKAPTVTESPKRSKRASEATDDGQIDYESFCEEAADRFGPGRSGLYRLQDERLIARGMPATSPWWRWTFESFFESELTWLLAMVGRGAGKSTFLERLLLIVIMMTERSIPPGQTYQAPFFSVLPEDARRRIYEIKALLFLAYGLDLKVKDGGITIRDISGNDIEAVSLAGTVGRASGPSTVSVIFDEAAKLHTSAGAANNDAELIASIVGTSRLLPGWTGVRCSSAYETRGAHFLSVMAGTNGQNFVATIGVDFIDAALAGLEDVARWESAQGNSHDAARIRSFAKTLHPGSPNVPTWVARPEQSALRLRMMLDTLPRGDAALEGLTRSEFWLREYASMPLTQDGTSGAIDACLLAGAMTARLHGRDGRTPGQPMKVPGARPGDARYAGPKQRGAMSSTNWRTRRSI